VTGLELAEVCQQCYMSVMGHNTLLGSPKAVSMHDRRVSRVMIVDVSNRTMLVSFTAQTCAMPTCMNKTVYRIFILLSTKVSNCIVNAMWMAWMNCSVLYLLPSKISGPLAQLLESSRTVAVGWQAHEDTLCY